MQQYGLCSKYMDVAHLHHWLCYGLKTKQNTELHVVSLPLACIHQSMLLFLCRLMESYRKDAEQHGAVVALNCEVIGGKVSGAATHCVNSYFNCPSRQVHWQCMAAADFESSSKS